jgi:hypothetical protein
MLVLSQLQERLKHTGLLMYYLFTFYPVISHIEWLSLTFVAGMGQRLQAATERQQQQQRRPMVRTHLSCFTFDGPLEAFSFGKAPRASIWTTRLTFSPFT